jgi:hypothetical protein
MTIHNDSQLLTLEPTQRWRFDWVLPALFQPRRTFAQIAAVGTGIWLTPITILLVTTLGRVLLIGSIKQAAAASGQVSLPPGFEFYTPEQQAQFQQAMTATSGPVFTYVLPAVMAILGVFLAWLVLGWVLHLVLTLLGGRGSSQQVLNVAAWASLPLAVRDVVRIGAMLNTDQLIAYAGLSGFASTGDGNMTLYLAALLALIDIYLLWHILLLAIGARASDNLSAAKAWGAVIFTVVGLLLLRALPPLIAAQFSDLTIIRPFF